MQSCHWQALLFLVGRLGWIGKISFWASKSNPRKSCFVLRRQPSQTVFGKRVANFQFTLCFFSFSMYQYSLASYLDVFEFSLKKSMPDTILQKRLKNIMDTLTHNVYNYGCTGELCALIYLTVLFPFILWFFLNDLHENAHCFLWQAYLRSTSCCSPSKSRVSWRKIWITSTKKNWTSLSRYTERK